MATLEQFLQLRSSVLPETQTELYALSVKDLDAAIEKMIAIGADRNVSFTAEELRAYLQELDSEDEFDDIQLDEATLAAVCGGYAPGMSGFGHKGIGWRHTPDGRKVWIGPEEPKNPIDELRDSI